MVVLLRLIGLLLPLLVRFKLFLKLSYFVLELFDFFGRLFASLSSFGRNHRVVFFRLIHDLRCLRTEVQQELLFIIVELQALFHYFE